MTMESLAYLDQRLPRRDLFKGFWVSILLHCLVFSSAMLGGWGLSRKGFEGSVATVSLVSLQDIGLAPAPLAKGSKSATGEGFRGSETAATPASSPQTRSAPVVPVKRLQVKETAEKPPTELKKLEPAAAPTLPEKAPSTASIDKDIEKLIPRPKSPPKVASQPQLDSTPKGAQLAAVEKEGERNPKAVREGPARGAPEGSARGEPEGSAKGVAEGSGRSTGGGGGGSGEGGRVASSLLGFYGDRVKETISRNWVFSEAIKMQGLETRLTVVVNRDGNILDLRVEKTSGNAVFDESAIRAVRKSAPLPPLPQVISYPKVEIGIRFSPEGLS